MNKYNITILLLLVLSGSLLKAQDTVVTIAPRTDTVHFDKFSAGGGIGYEYGGGGANVIYYPFRNLGVFGGAGWNIVGFGYNVGIKIRAIIDESNAAIIPFVECMYGYNTTIYYPDNTQYNKIFYNATIGGGIDVRPGNWNLGFFTLAVYVPFRDPDVKNYINEVNYFWGVPYSSSRIFPLSASIGFKLILR